MSARTRRRWPEPAYNVSSFSQRTNIRAVIAPKSETTGVLELSSATTATSGVSTLVTGAVGADAGAPRPAGMANDEAARARRPPRDTDSSNGTIAPSGRAVARDWYSTVYSVRICSARAA